MLRVLPLVLVLIAFAPPLRAEVVATLFWQEGCPYCERARDALAGIAADRPGLRVREVELGVSTEGDAMFARAVEELGLTRAAVPLFVIGRSHVLGFSAATGTGMEYRGLIAGCLATGCADIFGDGAPPAPSADVGPGAMEEGVESGPSGEVLHLPLLGELRLADLSLPVLTVLLAAVDGFNPCAMWVLAILIGFLLGVEDRRRMWILGGVFLFATGAMYFAVMAAWLNVVLWIGALGWLRLVIGTAAVVAGAWYLREYWTNPESICRVTPSERRRSLTARFRALVEEPSLPLAALGIGALAVAVNLVELVCSAGVPAIYTQMLAMRDLPMAAHYGYLSLYLAVFLLDDVTIFVAAMVMLRAVVATGRFARASHLVGGVVLIGLGAVMVLRPDLLA